jgi:hypothetical protein
MTESTPPGEVEQLKAENERLRAAVDEEGRKYRRGRRLRRYTAAVLAFLSALLLVLGVVTGWSSRTALDTDRFVSRVGPIIDQPAVKTAVSTEISDQLIAVLDLQDRIKPVLPPNLQFVAGPIAAGAEDVVRNQVTKVVESPQFRTVWYAALRLAHEATIKVLTGSAANVQVVNGKLVINLIGVVNLVLQNLDEVLPSLFGTAVSLQIPDNLPVDQIRALVEKYLGVTLPPNFAEIPVMDASSLEAARTGYHIINLSVVLVLVLTLVAFVLALVASTDRRRTLLQFGLWLTGITTAVFFVLRGLTNSTLDTISDPVLRPAAVAGVHELFSSLRGFAILLFWVGILLALAMYLIGPGSFPVWLRRETVRGWHWLVDRGRYVASHEGYAGWVQEHLDPLRIGGGVVAALLLLFLQSWTALIVIGVLLVLYEVAVTLWARSAPAAIQGEEAPESVVEAAQHSDVP